MSMNKLSKAILIATATASVLATGCRSTKQFPQGDWKLVDFSIDGEQQNIVECTISFSTVLDADGEIIAIDMAGFSGVNNFSGGFTVDDGKVVHQKELVSTKMAGPQTATEFERAFLKCLAATDSWKITKDGEVVKLTLTSSSEKSSVSFVHYSLDETTWNLSEIVEGPQVDLFSNANVVFSSDRTAAIYTGINRVVLGYTYNMEKQTLSFQDGASTLAAGSDREMEIETAFLSAVSRTASYSVSGKELTFYDGEGKAVLRFFR